MTHAQDIDTRLAAVCNSIYRIEDRLMQNDATLLHQAGAKFYYRGRRRVTDMTAAEALEILTTIVKDNAGESDYALILPGAGSNLGQARSTIARREAFIAEREEFMQQRDELEAEYTGWSRFFLVTSSPGHVHSSMHCSTCRPTTRYGWLPQLSGSDEATAVDELGPTLCTVCFPSAPTEWTEGKKITAAQAAKKVA
jgi:hypothetical protein